ncbi:MAG: putative quinol monooxygenase [Prochloraceae cyanobacterium]
MNEPKIKAFQSFLSILTITVIATACNSSAFISNNSPKQVAKESDRERIQTQEVSVPVVLAATLKVKPEKRELFLKLATATLEPTRAEIGSISYSFYEESNVPNTFLYFEEWTSREALAKHLEKPYVKDLIDRFPEILEADPDVKVYDIDRVTQGLELE